MFEDVFPKYTDHLYDMTGADVYQDIAGWIGDKRNMDIKKQHKHIMVGRNIH